MNFIRDTIHLYDLHSGASDEYCKGAVVGLVAGLLANGLWTFDYTIQCMRKAYQDHPEYRPLTPANCPACWISLISKGF